MKVFEGKVAVITGAASGIGYAIAERCAQESMKLVLADIEEDALADAAAQLRAKGAEVLTVRTDVSKPADIETLAKQTLDAFGAVHLLCNNAGVASGSTVWESALADWEWVLGVNLWGVIYGLRTFTPIMLEQGDECHIVNTASIAGLLSAANMGPYNVTKHGVVTLSETLYAELKQRKANIGVSVLCPEFVKTRIWESARNRPDAMQTENVVNALGPDETAFVRSIRNAVQNGISPEEVAECVFDAVRNDQLYILTHPKTRRWVRRRMENIVSGCNPLVPGID